MSASATALRSGPRPSTIVLRGTLPPDAPDLGTRPLRVNLTPPEMAFLRCEAADLQLSLSRTVRLFIRDRMRQRDLPRDVRLWLLAQAAQQGYPGDWERALVATVRQLAVTYPVGIRLDDDPVSAAPPG